jgi:hypothetical protein
MIATAWLVDLDRAYVDAEDVSSSEVAHPGSVSRSDHDMGDCGLAEFVALSACYA